MKARFKSAPVGDAKTTETEVRKAFGFVEINGDPCLVLGGRVFIFGGYGYQDLGPLEDVLKVHSVQRAFVSGDTLTIKF